MSKEDGIQKKSPGLLEEILAGDEDLVLEVLELGLELLHVDCVDLLERSDAGVEGRGGSLVLTDMQPLVREVFDITGFSGIIKII